MKVQQTSELFTVMQGEAVTVIGTEKPQGVDTLYGDLWTDWSLMEVK